MLHFTTFHNVSMYMRCPQKLVMCFEIMYNLLIYMENLSKLTIRSSTQNQLFLNRKNFTYSFTIQNYLI